MLAYFFFVLSSVTNHGEQFLRVKRSFDNYSGSYKVISVTANSLLKTQYIEKKRAAFSVKKIISLFLRSIANNYYPGTKYKGPDGF